MTAPTPPSNPINRLLVAGVLVLSALCVLLTLQNRELKARIAADTLRPSFSSGDHTGPLTLVDGQGIVTQLNFPHDRPTLVLCAGVGCGYCHDAAPGYHDVIASAPTGSIRVVWVVLDATEPAQLTQESSQLGEPALHLAQNARETWLRQVNITPSAVLLGPDGSVVKCWTGLPSREDLRDLRLAVIDAAGSTAASTQPSAAK